MVWLILSVCFIYYLFRELYICDQLEHLKGQIRAHQKVEEILNLRLKRAREGKKLIQQGDDSLISEMPKGEALRKYLTMKGR